MGPVSTATAPSHTLFEYVPFLHSCEEHLPEHEACAVQRGRQNLTRFLEVLRVGFFLEVLRLSLRNLTDPQFQTFLDNLLPSFASGGG